MSAFPVELVNKFKLLGVTVDKKLSFVDHVTDVLTTNCFQRMYLLKLFRDQGMPFKCLHTIYVSLIVNKVTYCISAWGGFIKEFYISKINSLFRKAVKYGYTDTLYDFHGLLLHHDEKLYSKIIFDNHCLHHLDES